MLLNTPTIITPPVYPAPRPIELQVAFLRRRGLSADRAALVASLAFTATAEQERAVR